MATTPTAKLGIPLPVAGSGEPFTVAAYNFGVATLDGAAGAAVVTSGSRPGSPFSGQVIFETDTLRSYVYDGSVWQPLGSVGGGRNLLYNGAIQVAQRGTSSTNLTGPGYYTADRWRSSIGTMGTWTQTVENDGPTGSGFAKSLKMECTTADAAPAAGDTLNISQRLEGQDLQGVKKGTSAAEQLTVSFWVKSNVTGTYVAQLVDRDNTRQVGAQYTVSASGTWEKKTITFSADTTGAFNNDNGDSLDVVWWLGAGSDRTSGTLRTTWTSTTTADIAVGQTNLAAATSNYWQVTGVQLEVGPVATEFEFKQYEEELSECQRYYYRTDSGNDTRLGVAFNRNTTTANVFIDFPVTMRTAPTALEQNGTAAHYGMLYLSTGAACSAVPTFSSAHTNAATSIFTVASGLTAGQGSLGYSITGNNGYLAWSAEL